MTPAARTQAVIDILDALFASIPDAGRSLDSQLRRYFTKRRYAGSSDRRHVRERGYAILRDFQNLTWQLERAGCDRPDGRKYCLAQLAMHEDDPTIFFSGGKYAPAPLDEAECILVDRLTSGEKAPDWARLNCPLWLFSAFEKRFGPALGDGLTALNGRAPLGLRVNSIKTDRPAAIAFLEADGITATPCALADDGLIAESGANVNATRSYLEGRVEVQDEGSQIAAALVAPEPGSDVVDLCAGAGGKSLALAAAMGNKGRLLAADIAPTKLGELEKRARRAGVTMIERFDLKPFEEAQARAEQLNSLAAASRVLVDAPCSGSGTWRRQPELRLRFNEQGLNEILAVQRKLLSEAAGRVAPGGRLIYVTCSLLAAENEDQCALFLDRHPGWQPLDWKEIWAAQPLGPAPVSNSPVDSYLQLVPHLHGTDGFFIAIFEAPAACGARDESP